MKIPEPTRREKAAAGNGPLEEYVEYQAEVNRDPAEYRGGSQVGYMTNAEMFRSIRRLIEAQYDDVMKNGCCKRMDKHGFCQYLQQQCPILVKGNCGNETNGPQRQISQSSGRDQASADDDQGMHG